MFTSSAVRTRHWRSGDEHFRSHGDRAAQHAPMCRVRRAAGPRPALLRGVRGPARTVAGADRARLIGAIHEQGPGRDARRRDSARRLARGEDRAAAGVGVRAAGTARGRGRRHGHARVRRDRSARSSAGTSVETLAERAADRGRPGSPGDRAVRQRSWPSARRSARMRASDRRGAPAAAAAAAASRRPPRQRPRRRRRAPPTPTTEHRHDPGRIVNGLPPVKHVFLIVLSDRGFTQSFAPAQRRLSGRRRFAGRASSSRTTTRSPARRSPTRSRSSAARARPRRPRPTARCSRASSPRTRDRVGRCSATGASIPTRTKTLAEPARPPPATPGRPTSQGVPREREDGLPRARRLGSKASRRWPARTNAYLAWRNPFLYFRVADRRRRLPHRRGRLRAARQGPEEREHHARRSPTSSPPACADGSEAPCRPTRRPGSPPPTGS